MVSTLTNPRSSWPYIIMVAMFLTPACILSYMFTYEAAVSDDTGGGMVVTQVNSALAAIAAVLLLIGIGYTIFMAIRTAQYRKQYPSVSLRALMFADSRDDDEMLTAMTGHAARVALGVSELFTIVLVGLFMWQILPANPFWIVTTLSLSLICTMVSYAISMRNVSSAES